MARRQRCRLRGIGPTGLTRSGEGEDGMDFAGRSIHGVPRHARKQAEHPVLLLEGAVRAPRSFFLAILLSYRAFPSLRSITIREQSIASGLQLVGHTLRAIIDLAEPNPAPAGFTSGAGPYATVVAMADADAVLPLRRSRRCPNPGRTRRTLAALVKPDDRYFTECKWVDRITVSIEQPDNSAVRIAHARQRARDAKA